MHRFPSQSSQCVEAFGAALATETIVRLRDTPCSATVRQVHTMELPMPKDTMIAEKVRRRLAPMIVGQRIKEPAVTRSKAFSGSEPSYIVTVRPHTEGAPSDLRG